MASSIGNQLISLILSFVSRTLFLRILGVGYLGINGLFNDVLSMLNMAELGFGTAMTYGMYKPLAENDYDTLAALTNFYKKVYHIIAATILIIGVALLPFLPYIVNLEHDIPHIEIYYLLFLLSNVASYLVTYKTTILYADQKNYILLQYGALWHIAEIFVMLLVLYITKSYLLYLITQLLFVYGRNFHMSHLATKQYPYLKRKVALGKDKKQGIFKDVGSAFLYKIAKVLITGTDNALISVLVSTEMVGFYSNYQIVASKISSLVGTVFYSSITSVGNLLVEKCEEKKQEVFQTMQSLCLMVTTFCATCLFLLQEDFIRVWLGEAYVLGTVTVLSVVFNFYFELSTAPVSTFREAAGLFRKTKYLMLWTALLNLLFSVVLGRIIGLSGIIFATSLSKLLTSFWYEPKLLFRDYFNKPCRYYFADMLLGGIITIVITLCTWLLSSWLVPTNWLQLICKGVLVAGIAMFLTIVFYRRTPGFQLAKSKLFSILAPVRQAKEQKENE